MVSNQSMSSPPPEAAALSPHQREAPLREIVVFIDGHTKAGGSTVSRIRRILVGWNARRESIRAVADAMPALMKAEAVEVLVIDHERTAGHGQEPAAEVARHLARRGVKVETRRLSSAKEKEEVGRLLLSQAAIFGADLLVMGAYGHSQLREWMFGSVTRTVLREAGLPVLMSR
jgi:nucleotide-binding universal stress UspA family protein